MTYREENDVDEIIVEPAHKGPGRFSEYTPEIGDDICKNVQIGMTFKDAANMAGYKEKTARHWLSVHSGFSAAYARAKLKRKQRLIATVRGAASKDWRAALSMLQALYPEEWAKQKLLALVKKTDKAGELIAMLFSEADSLELPAGAEGDSLPDFIASQDPEVPLETMIAERGLPAPQVIDITPSSTHDAAGTPVTPDAERPTA